MLDSYQYQQYGYSTVRTGGCAMESAASPQSGSRQCQITSERERAVRSYIAGEELCDAGRVRDGINSFRAAYDLVPELEGEVWPEWALEMHAALLQAVADDAPPILGIDTTEWQPAVARLCGEAAEQSSGSAWWATAAAIGAVAAALDERHFAVLDAFAGAANVARLRQCCTEASDDFQPARSPPADALRGAPAAARSDCIAWDPPGFSELSQLTDRLVGLLRQRQPEAYGAIESRQRPMVGRYGFGDAFARHVDNFCRKGAGELCNGRVLTAVYYMQEPSGWDAASHGGCLRIFGSQMPSEPGEPGEPGDPKPTPPIAPLTSPEAMQKPHPPAETSPADEASGGQAATLDVAVVEPPDAEPPYAEPPGAEPPATDHAAATPPPTDTAALLDIAPLGDRLVLFHSDFRCPHEVLPVRQKGAFRLAATIWCTPLHLAPRRPLPPAHCLVPGSHDLSRPPTSSHDLRYWDARQVPAWWVPEVHDCQLVKLTPPPPMPPSPPPPSPPPSPPSPPPPPPPPAASKPSAATSTPDATSSTSASSAADDESDARLLLRLLRVAGLPLDLAAVDPRSLAEAMAQARVRTVGQRQRLFSLLHRQAAESTAAASARAARARPPLDPLPASFGDDATDGGGGIPRCLFTFWQDDPSAPRARAGADAELVRGCLGLMRQRCAADGWEFRVLSAGAAGLPPPPVDDSTRLTGAQLADWYRLAALAEHGGVYLDATCVVLAPLEAWVDCEASAVQGFSFVPDGQTLESWAIAAPRGSAFAARWRDEFGRALSVGVKAYCDRLPAGVVSEGLRPSLTDGYLAIHAAWRVVHLELPHVPVRLTSPIEAGQPYRFLAESRWDSPRAVAALFGKSEAALGGTPLIKLRGKERDSVQPLATYGRHSALARHLPASPIISH